MNGTSTNEIVYCKATNHLIVASHKGLFAWKLGTKVPMEDRYKLFCPGLKLYFRLRIYRRCNSSEEFLVVPPVKPNLS